MKHSRHKLRRIIYTDIDCMCSKPPAKQHSTIFFMVLSTIIVREQSIIWIENSACKGQSYYPSVDMSRKYKVCSP